MFSQSTHTKIHLYTFSITRYDIHTRWCVHVIYDLFTSWMYKNKWCKFSTNGDRIYTRTHAGASSYYSLKDGTQRPRLSCPSPPLPLQCPFLSIPIHFIVPPPLNFVHPRRVPQTNTEGTFSIETDRQIWACWQKKLILSLNAPREMIYIHSLFIMKDIWKHII